jgi:predicted N-acetyltransferase YhbS
VTHEKQKQAPGPDWHARLYRPGDETGIVALYERVFGYRRTPEWWRWKIKSFPSAVELTWVAVAERDGSIIGHYPGIPIRLKLDGEVRPAIVNLDVMTSPDYRRRGILLHLGEAANRHWREAGYAAVVGLPNEQWGSRTQALGWQTIFPLGWLRFPLHIGKVAARSGRLPRAAAPVAHLAGEAVAYLWSRPRVRRLAQDKSVQVEEVTTAGEEFDLLWACLEGAYHNSVVRDAAYVRWRFLSALPVPYKLLLARDGEEPLGYIAYRYWSPRGGTTAYIADLFTAPGDTRATNALLAAALRDLWQQGAGTAMVTAVPGSALHSTLREAGARPLEAAFHYDLISLDPTLDITAMSDPELWIVSGSDSDVV